MDEHLQLNETYSKLGTNSTNYNYSNTMTKEELSSTYELVSNASDDNSQETNVSSLDLWNATEMLSSHFDILGSSNLTLYNQTESDLRIGPSLNFTPTASPTPEKVYWAIALVVLPFLTIFGNILVILSVYKEKNLKTATNYFIVSLAFADLLVAITVMPFAVYILVSLSFKDYISKIS